MTSLPASVRLDPNGHGGPPVVRVDGAGARAEIYLHGATVTDWTPRGSEPVLWVSSQSRFTHERPIRGGVPIYFPWFGPSAGHPELFSHGFARLSDWSLVGAHDDGGDVTLRLRLSDLDATGASVWPHRFEAIYTIVVGARLSLALTVTNSGTDGVVFEEAFHTYLGVRDIGATEVTGLEGTTFYDQLAGPEPVGGEPHGVRFEAETDRIYVDADTSTTVRDLQSGRSVLITKSGAGTTMVWNSWITKAADVNDFGDDEWKTMVCVEVCNIGDAAIRLAPGGSHTMTAMFELPPTTRPLANRSLSS
jgi:D-hexose-6-phosphate mutarotase